MLSEKIKTGLWFLKRPTHWMYAVALIQRKFQCNKDTPLLRSNAKKWASQQTVLVNEALFTIGLLNKTGGDIPTLPDALIVEAEVMADTSQVKMGGPGDLALLYAAALLSKATRVIETGVAYGWSSLAILAALEKQDGAKLVSVDMPYPKMGNENWVGVVVSERFRSNWHLIREPDRNGLKKAIALFDNAIDLCHYDSDKSYQGRRFAYPILWNALRPGGIFISDDIQDNLAFKEFVGTHNTSFAVTEFQGKYVGIVSKPPLPTS